MINSENSGKKLPGLLKNIDLSNIVLWKDVQERNKKLKKIISGVKDMDL